MEQDRTLKAGYVPPGFGFNRASAATPPTCSGEEPDFLSMLCSDSPETHPSQDLFFSPETHPSQDPFFDPDAGTSEVRGVSSAAAPRDMKLEEFEQSWIDAYASHEAEAAERAAQRAERKKAAAAKAKAKAKAKASPTAKAKA